MKKNKKRFLFSGLALSLLVLLSGCVSVKNGHPTGTIWNILGVPMANLITFFAKNQGLGFGIAIILVTIIVRLIILPLGLYQSYKASYQAEKMNYLKPVFEPINERIRNASTQEEKMAAQTELMQAQREAGVSILGGVGCLPLIIQMPFFSAIFVATRYTEGVSEATFLGMSLGKQSIILVLIIAALYYVQSWLSLQTAPEAQRSQMKTMTYTMPLVMLFMSISLPASVALYWFVGGIFSIIQQLIATYIIKPRLRKRVEEEYKKNPPRAITPKYRKDVTQKTKNTAAKSAILQPAQKKRNIGKQKKRKS
ncbi:membrane protein insertase YidC [Streptococcus sciuri]|uniref:Membrane protein insertase YidC n=1 Tax=Streptococcus sciuri TaxID=2973939 RepID=A0ABT2F8N7_9STRE|nr:membrane protein insertase YidC [Streptococcus sciuri]MCS4488845.1 membrane protein insertase YidC [Streptococcus sciuri]